LTIGFVADVALHKSAAQFFGHSFTFFCLHVGNHHFAAMGGKHAGRSFAQA
jgi:hypothetical protein